MRYRVESMRYASLEHGGQRLEGYEEALQSLVMHEKKLICRVMSCLHTLSSNAATNSKKIGKLYYSFQILILFYSKILQ